MDDNKQFIFLLIMMVGFYFIFTMYFKGPDKQEQKKETATDNKIVIDTNKKNVEDSQFELIETPQENNPSLIFENNNIKVEFDPHDAVIKHAIVFDTFLVKEDKSQIKAYDLINPRSDDERALRLKFGEWDKDITLAKLTGGNNLYHYERNGDQFIFTAKMKEKQSELIYTIQKVYTFMADENLFKMDIKLSNNKNVPLQFDHSDYAYSIAWGPQLGIESRKDNINKRQINLISYLNDDNKIEKFKEKEFKGKDEDYVMLDKVNSWIAFNGHYFSSVLYSDEINFNHFFDYTQKGKTNYYCGFAKMSEKSNLESTFYIYIGPKLGSVLGKYQKAESNPFNVNITEIKGIDSPIIFGIGNLIGKLLSFIYKIVKNYGLAIILLTIIIKLVLFPLTYKSMESQQRMSQLQPKIKDLQQKYKDKPEMLNKATMELYKKEKINPLGGCLPMILQMPILFGMYQLLNRMVALKGASFLWIKDLSLPDGVGLFEFGFNIPFVNISSLNILPIIMVGVQVLSSIVMPTGQGNQQTKIMMWALPLVFFFIFYNVSSGLVLYWTVMNLLNLVQQIYTNNIMKKKQANA